MLLASVLIAATAALIPNQTCEVVGVELLVVGALVSLSVLRLQAGTKKKSSRPATAVRPRRRWSPVVSSGSGARRSSRARRAAAPPRDRRRPLLVAGRDRHRLRRRTGQRLGPPGRDPPVGAPRPVGAVRHSVSCCAAYRRKSCVSGSTAGDCRRARSGRPYHPTGRAAGTGRGQDEFHVPCARRARRRRARWWCCSWSCSRHRQSELCDECVPERVLQRRPDRHTARRWRPRRRTSASPCRPAPRSTTTIAPPAGEDAQPVRHADDHPRHVTAKGMLHSSYGLFRTIPTPTSATWTRPAKDTPVRTLTFVCGMPLPGNPAATCSSGAVSVPIAQIPASSIRRTPRLARHRVLRRRAPRRHRDRRGRLTTVRSADVLGGPAVGTNPLSTFVTASPCAP